MIHPNTKLEKKDLLLKHNQIKLTGKEREFGFERGRRESFAQA